MELEAVDIFQRDGEPVLVVDRECRFSHVLLSIQRNNDDWLSPLGWVSEAKSTALECRPIGHQVEIIIPHEDAHHLKDGDSLHIVCRELGFEQTVRWAGLSMAGLVYSEPEIEMVPEVASYAEDPLEATVPPPNAYVPEHMPTVVAEAPASAAIVTTSTGPGKKFAVAALAAVVVAGGVGFMAMRGSDDPVVLASNSAPSLTAPKSMASRTEALAESVDIAAVVEDNAYVETPTLKSRPQDEPRVREEVAPKPKPTDEVRIVPKTKPKPVKAPERVELSESSEVFEDTPGKTDLERREAPAEPAPRRANVGAIQNSLMLLGLYQGSPDGKVSTELFDSIRAFKTLYNLPVDEDVTLPFLEALKKAETDKLAEISTASTPPMTQPDLMPEPEYRPGPEPMQLPGTIEPNTSSRSDLEIAPLDIVEATVKSTGQAVYPQRALRRGFKDPVEMTMGFNLSDDGRLEDIEVIGTDYSGEHMGLFEKEAILLLKRSRYEPKRISGEAVPSTGHAIKIVFPSPE